MKEDTKYMKKEPITQNVAIDKGVHARMRIHVAKAGLKIKVWIEKVILNAIRNGE